MRMLFPYAMKLTLKKKKTLIGEFTKIHYQLKFKTVKHFVY